MNMIYIFRNNTKGNFMERKRKRKKTNSTGLVVVQKKKMEERRHDLKFETGFP